MIQHAKISEITDILVMTNACRLKMEENGIYQWTTQYPSKHNFEKDIERNELYILKEHNQIIGCIVLSSLMDDEYQPAQWLTKNNNNLYIHRLGIHPSVQGKGFARQLMDFAENYAVQNNFLSVRLDTFSQNKRNQKFYEARGYQKLENIYFPKQSEFPFHCYELVL
ncbi:GNAT family N-acetyltransferase [Maribacter sp. CXY002]|uniref:GNAT family N-acetyltransferase n=1 Tax=Maribacter luteocoastalis TaxID=3407671 RepID=UPI003B6758A2